MKNLLSRQAFTIQAILLLFMAGTSQMSCQKKYLGPDISYGTLFNRLQKMVVSNSEGVTTHSFAYDANGLITSHNILFKGKNPSRTQNSMAQYYRNGTGTVDSIKVVATLEGAVTAVKKIYFTYSSGTQLSSSVVLHNTNDASAMRDSSTYAYNGSFLIERKDYVTSGTTPYSATAYRDLVFQYSGTNISNLIFENTIPGGSEKKTTLISYSYDTAKAALPVNGFQYGYDSVCFAWQEYKAVNNLSSAKYGEGAGIGNISYEYNYLDNGKPFKGTSRETNAAGDAIESKIEFFYD